MSAQPEWQQLALYALGGAAVLFILFRLPVVGRFFRGLFSFAMLALFVFVLLRQASFEPSLARFVAPLGLDSQRVAGGEVRIGMSRDGHFWGQATINGVPRRMLIDSGATVTAVSQDTARLAGIETDPAFLPVVMRTANGAVTARTGSVESLKLGDIEARNLKVVTAPGLGPMDVLGMNFLSQLASWRVEGRTLILTPKGPPRELQIETTPRP